MKNAIEDQAAELASLREKIKTWKPQIDRLEDLDPKVYREEILQLKREAASERDPYKQNTIQRRIIRLEAQLALLEHIKCL